MQGHYLSTAISINHNHWKNSWKFHQITLAREMSRSLQVWISKIIHSVPTLGQSHCVSSNATKIWNLLCQSMAMNGVKVAAPQTHLAGIHHCQAKHHMRSSRCYYALPTKRCSFRNTTNRISRHPTRHCEAREQGRNDFEKLELSTPKAHEERRLQSWTQTLPIALEHKQH